MSAAKVKRSKKELTKRVSQFPVPDNKYFDELMSRSEDDAVFRRYIAMEDDYSGTGSTGSSSSSSYSGFGLDLEKLGITEAEIDEFLRRAAEFSTKKRRNSLLDKLPHEQYLPYILKNLLATQVRSRASEEEFQGRLGSSRDQDSLGYTLETDSVPTDGLSIEGDWSEAVKGSDGFVGEQEKIPPALDTDKERTFYINKEIGRRGGANAKLADDIDERLHRRWSRTVWRQEMENLEPEYRLPVLILKKFKFIRENEPGRIGPGTYDVDYYQIQKDKRNRTTRGLMQNCTRRFPKEKLANENPGPGTYEYLGYEAFEDHCRHPGKVPLFQSGPCNVRGDTFKAIGSSLGPGQYKYKTGIEMLLSRKVSKRGPYDVYTPSRAIIPHGYQKTAPVSPLGPGEYTIRTSLTEEFDKPELRYKGLFSKYNTAGKVTGERITLMAPFWPRNTADTPGPGQYDPQPYTRVLTPNKHPFCQTAAARPADAGDYDMSPDKYRPELGPIYCPKGCGHPSTFKSKSQRLDLAKIGVLTERLRGKDLPADHYTKITWAKRDYCIR